MISFDNGLKLIGVAGAIASFLWGVYQWREKANAELETRKFESQRLVDTRRIEATKPFLNRQLELYSEVTKVAAQVATLGTTEAGMKAQARFWELYWGELSMVENRAVEGAMKRMGDALEAHASPPALKQAALAIAHACRESLDKSWGIRAWSAPDDAASTAPHSP